MPQTGQLSSFQPVHHVKPVVAAQDFNLVSLIAPILFREDDKLFLLLENSTSRKDQGPLVDSGLDLTLHTHSRLERMQNFEGDLEVDLTLEVLSRILSADLPGGGSQRGHPAGERFFRHGIHPDLNGRADTDSGDVRFRDLEPGPKLIQIGQPP